MTSTESAYVGGIIDGEGYIEFKWADRIRRNRKGTPTYRTLIVRLEVPQVDKRLIDLKKATEKTVFVFDDIYWSAEMIEAWQEIKHNKKVTLTIDTFYMGLVFFKKEKAKQLIDHYDKKFFKKVFGKGGIGK